MAFPAHDPYWNNCLSFLQIHMREGEVVFAPSEFIEVLPGKVYSYSSGHSVDFQWAVIHKGMLADIKSLILKRVIKSYTPVFANEVFVVFSNRTDLPEVDLASPHIVSFK